MSPKPHLITQKRSPTQSLPSPKDPAKSTPAHDSSTAQQQAASAAVQIITGLGAEPEQAEAPLALPISKLAGGAIIYRFAQLSPARDGHCCALPLWLRPARLLLTLTGRRSPAELTKRPAREQPAFFSHDVWEIAEESAQPPRELVSLGLTRPRRDYDVRRYARDSGSGKGRASRHRDSLANSRWRQVCWTRQLRWRFKVVDGLLMG